MAQEECIALRHFDYLLEDIQTNARRWGNVYGEYIYQGDGMLKSNPDKKEIFFGLLCYIVGSFFEQLLPGEHVHSILEYKEGNYCYGHITHALLYGTDCVIFCVLCCLVGVGWGRTH
jgi:hypothetical protein